jgi:hypothetical protein
VSISVWKRKCYGKYEKVSGVFSAEFMVMSCGCKVLSIMYKNISIGC